MPVNAGPRHGQAVHLLVLLGRHPEELQAVQGLRGDREGEGLMPGPISRLASAGRLLSWRSAWATFAPLYPDPASLGSPLQAPPIVLQVTKELLLLRWPHIPSGLIWVQLPCPTEP